MRAKIRTRIVVCAFVVFSLFGIAITGLMVVLALTAVQHRFSQAVLLNYEVNGEGTITLIRPDVPEQKVVLSLGIARLPRACLGAGFNHDDWKPGEWGRLAFTETWCHVVRGASWDPAKAAAHHHEREKQQRQQRRERVRIVKPSLEL